jgi:hypothetical protein
MGCGSCGPEEKKKVKYECAVNPSGCPVKEVEETQPVPECCGQPMKKKE